jgi:hypothetical protein
VNKGWSETIHFPPHHEATKIGLGSADFAVIARVWEDSLLFLRVTHVKKKVCALLEPPHPPEALFTNPVWEPHKEMKETSHSPAKP